MKSKIFNRFYFKKQCHFYEFSVEVQPTLVLKITNVPRCFSFRAEQGTLKVNKVMVNSLEDTLGENQAVSWTLNTQQE